MNLFKNLKALAFAILTVTTVSASDTHQHEFEITQAPDEAQKQGFRFNPFFYFVHSETFRTATSTVTSVVNLAQPILDQDNDTSSSSNQTTKTKYVYSVDWPQVLDNKKTIREQLLTKGEMLETEPNSTPENLYTTYKLFVAVEFLGNDVPVFIRLVNSDDQILSAAVFTFLNTGVLVDLDFSHCKSVIDLCCQLGSATAQSFRSDAISNGSHGYS